VSTTRRLSVLIAAAATGLALAGPAGAAPAKGDHFSVTCAGLGTFQVVSTPGNGPFAPVFPVGTHRVLIPYAVHGTVTVAGHVVDHFDAVKPAATPTGAKACTFTGTFTENGVTATVAGTATVVVRGAP
jgi:hypothetical protein